MSTKEIQNPHDKLFKQSFGKKEVALSFFATYLPKPILKLLDLDQLKLLPNSFVDEEYKSFRSDLVYQVDFDGLPGYLTILFEHQSDQDPWMGMRLLIYMTKIWDHFRGMNPGKKAPFILPIVLSQCKGRWKVATVFEELFETPSPKLKEVFGRYTPNFEYLVVDLVDFDETVLRTNIYAHITMGLLKAWHQDNVVEFVKLRNIFNQLPLQDNLGLLEVFFRYILNKKGDKVSTSEVIEVVKENLKPELGEKFMTLAEKFEEKGEARGIVKGRAEGKAEGKAEGEAKGRRETLQQTLLKMIQKRFGDDQEFIKGVQATQDIAVLEDLIDTFLESADREILKAKLKV